MPEVQPSVGKTYMDNNTGDLVVPFYSSNGVVKYSPRNAGSGKELTSTWENFLSAHTLSDTAAYVDADFVNNSFKLNGATSTYGNIFENRVKYPLSTNDPAKLGTVTNGVGLIAEKTSGTFLNEWWLMEVKPSVLDALEASNGFTAVIDYKVVNPVHNLPSHFSGGARMEYWNDAYDDPYYSVDGTWHYGAPHGENNGNFTLYAYDAANTTILDNYTAAPVNEEGQFVLNMGARPSVSSDTPGSALTADMRFPGWTAATRDVPWPYAGANNVHLGFSGRAASHQGDNTTKLLVTGKFIVKRIRIFLNKRADNFKPGV